MIPQWSVMLRGLVPGMWGKRLPDPPLSILSPEVREALLHLSNVPINEPLIAMPKTESIGPYRAHKIRRVFVFFLFMVFLGFILFQNG